MNKFKLLFIPLGLLFFLMLIYSLGTYNNQVFFIAKHVLMFAFLGSLILVSEFIIHDVIFNRNEFERKKQFIIKIFIGIVGFLLLFVVANMQLKLVESETPFLVACDYYTMQKELVYKSYGDTCATYHQLGEHEYVFHEDVVIDGISTHYMTNVKFSYDEAQNRTVESYVYSTYVIEDQLINDLMKIVQTEYEDSNKLYVRNEFYSSPNVGVISALEGHIYPHEPNVYTFMVVHDEVGVGSVEVFGFSDDDETSKEFILRRYGNGDYSNFDGLYNSYMFHAYEKEGFTGQSIQMYSYDNTYPSSQSYLFEEKVIRSDRENYRFFSYSNSLILNQVSKLSISNDPKQMQPYEINEENSSLYVGADLYYRIEKVADGSLFELAMYVNTVNGLKETPTYLNPKERFDEFNYIRDILNIGERPRRFYHFYNPIFKRITAEVK